MKNVNMDLINKMVEEKYISVQEHPTEDLYIYNYTQKAQYEKMWNKATLMCRGLILDGEHNIVARPFQKFFNYEELETIPAETFKVYDKWDGSLGIMYWLEGKPYLATRGSFTSDQAKKGTELLHKFAGNFHRITRNATYLFEIIYPGNRIVVDYKGQEDVILLAVIDNETGKDLDLYEHHAGFPFASLLNGITDFKEIKSLQQDNKEGFVIVFESGLRVKLKFKEYVRLHRLLTECTARRLWEVLKEGQSLDTFLEKVPDEFYQWVKTTEKRLQEEFSRIEHETDIVHSKLLAYPNRKEQALALGSYRYRSIVFNMLDKKDYKGMIWKLIKPEHEVPFKTEI